MKRSAPRSILVVGGKWPPEPFIARRLQGLAGRGFRVSYASAGKPGAAKIQGVRWKRLPDSGTSLPSRVGMLGWNLLRGLLTHPRRTAQILRLGGKKGFHAAERLLAFAAESPGCLHFEWNLAAVHYLPLFELMKCPVVVSCRGSQVLVAPHNPSRAFECKHIPETFARASVVHCVSEAVARAAHSLGAELPKIRVIRPAVDTALFHPAPAGPGREDSAFRILMTCNLNWVKGYEYAFQAVAGLVRRGIDARLEVIGEADKTNRQRALFTIQDLDLTGRVDLRGPLPPHRIAEELRRADAFLLTSVSEGISNAVLEAMASGVPVVATACPGMEEAISDGIDGFLAPVRDPEAIAAALERLAGDVRLRSRIGASARRKAVAAFDMSRQMSEWTELYESLFAATPAWTGREGVREAEDRLLARR